MTQQLTSTPGAGYSIRVVSRLTGISADTLRMWERRYGFPKPERNATGVRVYTPEHVERLLLVARSLKAGYRAGEVIHQSREELGEMLAGAAAVPTPMPEAGPIQPILDALLSDDIDTLRSELRRSIATQGPKGFITEIAGPLLDRVGEEWSTRRLEIRHEHLLTQVLSSQLRNLLSAYEGSTREPVILFATLTGEQHALGMEMAALYVAIAGATPRILGPDTPTDQIVHAAQCLNARAVAISISAAFDTDAATSQLEWMLDKLPDETEAWIGGKRARGVTTKHPRLKKIVTWDELDEALAAMTPS